MFKKKNTDNAVDYETDFKVVIATNPQESTIDTDELKVHQSQHSLKSLESFSRSSESLALQVTPLESKKTDRDKPKKKSRSATRNSSKNGNKPPETEDSLDSTVSRDHGESYMSQIMRSVNRDSRKSLGDTEEEKLRLMNIRLESQVSRLCQENEEILAGRGQIKCELETVKQNLTDNKIIIENLEEEFESVKRDRELDQRKLTELEILLATKQADINKKSLDLEQMTKEIDQYQNSVEENGEKMRLIIEELNSKNYVISDLKKKISEFHSQLELMKLYQENSEYQSEQLQRELNSAKASRNELDSQLKRIEETKDKLQLEVYRVKNCLLESQHENESVRQKNKSLDLKLAKFHEIKLHETTALLFELEQLQKELIINEEEKRNLETQYSEITRKFHEKILEFESEQKKNSLLIEKTQELSVELEETKNQLIKSEETINNLELEATELRKKSVILEETLNQKILDIEQIELEKQEMENKVREMGESLSEKDSSFDSLKEEMRNLKTAFDRVSDERNQACVGIERLREEISQVEDQFELSRQNMAEKEQVLKLLEDLNEDLKQKMAKEAENSAEKDRNLAILRTENNQLLESRELFQQNNLEILKELETLRGSLNLANMRIAGLEDELLGMKLENEESNKLHSQSTLEVEKLKTDLNEAQEKLENLINVQEMYSKLCADHKRLEEGYNELYGQHRSLTEEFKLVTGKLQSQLEEREEELERIVSMKEEIICTTQKDLQCIDHNNKELKNELENLKFNHTVELATKEEQFRERLDLSSKQFSEMCQEKIRCEGAIASLQEHIKIIIEKYDRKLMDCKSKMLHLEQQSTEYAQFESERRSLLEKLEQKKGELLALLEVSKTMKCRTEMIENVLSSKDAHISHLQNQYEEALSKKEEEIKYLNEKLNNQYETLKTEENIKKEFLCEIEKRGDIIDQIRKKCDNYQANYLDMEMNLSKVSSNSDILVRESQLLKESEQNLTSELEKKIQENRQLSNINEELMTKIERMTFEKEKDNKAMLDLQLAFEHKSQEIMNCDKIHKDLAKKNKKVIDEMTNILKNANEQNDSLTRKVELSQQQEIVMSAIMGQIKSEIKKIIFQKEVQCGMEDMVTLSCDQLQQLNKLVNVIEEPTVSFRPQSRLSKCIEDLRTQIDSMQSEISKQIDEQMQSKESAPLSSEPVF